MLYICRLNPKQLQQTQSCNPDAKTIMQESRAETELHTVDFDLESQTKLVWCFVEMKIQGNNFELIKEKCLAVV